MNLLAHARIACDAGIRVDFRWQLAARLPGSVGFESSALEVILCCIWGWLGFCNGAEDERASVGGIRDVFRLPLRRLQIAWEVVLMGPVAGEERDYCEGECKNTKDEREDGSQDANWMHCFQSTSIESCASVFFFWSEGDWVDGMAIAGKSNSDCFHQLLLDGICSGECE